MGSYFKFLQEQQMLSELRSNNKGLIFLSETNMDGKTLIPRVPKNFLTENGFEDNKTKRVCFTQSIDNCLLSLSINCKNKMFYVHTPVGNYSVYYPTRAQVPDVEITREIWVCEPVELKCLGKILVIDRDGLPGRIYTYGNGLTDELFGWKWKYIV